jgi:hypothetical protein
MAWHFRLTPGGKREKTGRARIFEANRLLEQTGRANDGSSRFSALLA